MSHLASATVTLALASSILVVPATARAQGSPVCSASGSSCLSGFDCDASSAAFECVFGQCEIPCHTADGAPAPSLCGIGETCVYGETENGPTYYCKASPITMDLNLLDTCVSQFIDGVRPDLATTSVCSLEAALGRMLDRDGNKAFNIFDVDLCIRAFYDTLPCDTATGTCPDGRVFCTGPTQVAADARCGRGLSCNLALHACERECGLIASREGIGVGVVDRECTRPLTVCNYDRGRCEAVADVTRLTCQIDDDCPPAAVCERGRCARKCYRSVDCGDSTWYCSTGNRCLPRPQAGAADGFVFEPGAYAAQMTRKTLVLSDIENRASAPVVIMSLKSKKRELNPAVAFGYRLEVKYSRKQDDKCLRDPATWTPAELADCIISPEEEFVRVLSPFGAVYAAASNSFDFELNTRAIERLSPGMYQATVTAFFTNGGSDSATVVYEKTSPSGEYKGRLSVYVDGPNNLLGTTNFSTRLYVDLREESRIQWYALLAQENLGENQDILDITEGYAVSGYIHGTDAMVFDQPRALTNADNEIPVRGIYSPHTGRMRLIGVIDLPADYCSSDAGACSAAPRPDELQVRNPFGRDLRRELQLAGPFDLVTRKFHGIYRETISGLTPSPFTLDGGFELRQWRADETPLVLEGPLLADRAPALVTFPETAGLLAELDRAVTSTDPGGQIQRYCAAAGLTELYTDVAPGSAPFASAAGFHAYLDRFCTADAAQPGLCDATAAVSRVIPGRTTFGRQVELALAALGDATARAGALTINDFLRGQVRFCSDTVTDACIDEDELRCGLALYRKAILSGETWLSLTELGPVFPAAHELFCTETSAAAACKLDPASFPTVVSLQEHNRFYRELTQTLQYTAGNALSDAFYTLYRAADGAIERTQALSEKQQKLFAAWHAYNALQRELFAPVGSKVHFAWPMRSFQTMGRAVLGQMHAAVADRLDVVAEIIDLKRRLFSTADDRDFAFVQALMHQEYLTQAYLMALQKQWERQSFAYEGQGPAVLERGESIVARVNDTRNPLGIYPKQIFFENSNLGLKNWMNYRVQIMQGPPSNGLLQEVKTAVSTAVTNLKAALQDQATFETQILGVNHQFAQEIDSLCGPVVPVNPAAGACELLTLEEREVQAACDGPSCLYEYRCESDACDSVMRAFKSATGSQLAGTSCDLNTQEFPLQVGTTTRPCVRGQMGNLLQEREQLRLQREQVIRKVGALLRRVAKQAEHINDTIRENKDLKLFLLSHGATMLQLREGMIAAETAYNLSKTTAAGYDCLVIVGMANGTNCVGRAAKTVGEIAAIVIKSAVMTQLEVAREAASLFKEFKLTETSQAVELRRMRMDLDNMTTEVENLIAEYEIVTQMLFNLNVRIDDTYYLARRAAERYGEQVTSLVDHLTGDQTGNVLLRNQYVQVANARYQELMIATYKMAMAFIHSYNLKDRADQITNRVLQLMTPEDVEDFVRELDVFEANYCGGSGIDCDSANNTLHFRFSMREELFPTLRDVVDAASGKVLTRGEQFHDIITSTYMRTRERAGRLVEQIELPFAIWLNDRGDVGGYVQPWMVSPLECNHIIVGNGNGTMAVNAVGTRLRNLTYEIWRGNTDYLRACDPVQTVVNGVARNDYPINTFIVGYAPQNSLAQEPVPPSYVTHSPGLAACKNVPEAGGSFITNETCFKYFARDRSLAAPDWKLVIPFDVGYDNEWILGDEDPIIEDIVIYVRYRTRPI